MVSIDEPLRALPNGRLDEKHFLTVLCADQLWRLNNLYWIKDKEGNKVKFRMNEAQMDLYLNKHNRNIILKCRQRGFCLDPKTLVLTSDLRWVQIQHLFPGMKIVSVDEHSPSGKGSARKMRVGTVQAVVEVFRPAYRITFDDGRSVVCTDQHPWLSKTKHGGPRLAWRSIASKTKSKLKIGTKVRWVTKPWGAPDYEDGWFGGMLDGEGSISRPNSPASINVCQRKGPTWERLLRYGVKKGYNFNIEADKAKRDSKFGKTPVPKMCFGRMDEMFRLIGQTRPTRFIGNRFWEGRELPGKRSGTGWATIVDIEYVGTQRLIDLQTDMGTYIANGFVSHNTTFIQIYMLDRCLFEQNLNAGVIAHRDKDAQAFFKDKIKFAYDNLMPYLKAKFPAKNDSAGELRFANGSVIMVSTSLRSGTYRLLHISEHGKLCALFPERAEELRSGTLPTVPVDGEVFDESTAEGRHGDFYRMCSTAEKMAEENRELTALDYKFFFYPWQDTKEYTLDAPLELHNEDVEYFDSLKKAGIHLTDGQKMWYVKTKETLGDKMKQEFPTTSDEAFESSLVGAYFAKAMRQLRAKGMITRVPIDEYLPIMTFWDLGRDTTAIWFMQKVGMWFHFIDYFSNSNEDMEYYIEILRNRRNGVKPYNYGVCYLPHDGHSKTINARRSSAQILFDNDFEVEVVPRTPSHELSVQNARRALQYCYFDRVRCSSADEDGKGGIECLDSYRAEWDDKLETWKKNELHDWASHGSKAFMTFSDGFFRANELTSEEAVQMIGHQAAQHRGRNQSTGY